MLFSAPINCNLRIPAKLPVFCTWDEFDIIWWLMNVTKQQFKRQSSYRDCSSIWILWNRRNFVGLVGSWSIFIGQVDCGYIWNYNGRQCYGTYMFQHYANYAVWTKSFECFCGSYCIGNIILYEGIFVGLGLLVNVSQCTFLVLEESMCAGCGVNCFLNSFRYDVERYVSVVLACGFFVSSWWFAS